MAGESFPVLINWPTNLLEPVGELVEDSVVGRYLGLVQRLAQEMP